MAEPTSPVGEPTGDDAPVDEPSSTSRRRESPALIEPPTDEELAETGEPTSDEIHAAASGNDTEVTPASGAEVTPASDTEVIAPARTERLRSAEPEAVAPAPAAVQPLATEPESQPVTDPRTPVESRTEQPVPAEPEPAPVPAPESASPPPPRHGNRLVGTAWVLLAAGLFQVVFFGINALVALTFGGPAAALPQVQSVAQTALAWLPVLLLFLLFELTVLLFNRAGRVAYVAASLVVGLVVYIATVLLFSLIVRHTLGDANTLAQTFLNWEFIVVGLAAREVMLWTGLGIGSRGIRVRRRDREARNQYNEEVADARD